MSGVICMTCIVCIVCCNICSSLFVTTFASARVKTGPKALQESRTQALTGGRGTACSKPPMQAARLGRVWGGLSSTILGRNWQPEERCRQRALRSDRDDDAKRCGGKKQTGS